MILLFYDLLQPAAAMLFRVTVFILRLVGSERGAKLVQVLDMRYVNGRPAFEAVPVEKFGGKRPVWIHAASGEFEYAKPIVRELKNQGVPVFVTYFSPSYKVNVVSFPGVSAACALPLENRAELRSMLEKVNPVALLIARTDTWPNMVRESYAAKVPILLFSATFYEGSKRTRFYARFLTKATYHYIDEIQCVNHEDLRILLDLGFRRAVVRGDTRYDQVIARLEQTKDSVEKKLPDGITHLMREIVLVAGSIWEEDIEVLIPAIGSAQATFGNRQLTSVFVPHEISPRLIQLIQTKAKSHGLTTSVLSEIQKMPDEAPSIDGVDHRKSTDILIIDRVGILAELYLIGQLAFVGGSFKKTVHSVMEPLAAGCLTMVGPFHLNNREAIEFQNEMASSDFAAVVATKNSDELSRMVSSAVQSLVRLSSHQKQLIRERIQNQVRLRGKATDAVIEWIHRVRK